ncbi:MAG: hypothetical protein V3T22_07620 [Planctomycetota bacterium]
MLTRKIGKLLRGKATPFQLLAATVLGCWLGFVPGFAQASGWVLALVAMLLVLNANIGVALIVAPLAHLLALLLMPASFAVGRFLLEGPTAGLFRRLANAPVTAWFGLEHYATTGGIVLGLVVGLVVGALLVKFLTGFRRKLSALETDSERYQAFTSKGWVRCLTFVFVGGKKGKQTYEEILQKRIGNPVRILGVVTVVVVVGGGLALQSLIAGPVLTSALKNQLEAANGATVEVGAVELDLADSRLTIRNLALADPEDLGTDIFRAALLEADIGAFDFLRKRLTIERLAISEAHNGAPRELPGELIRPAGEPAPTTDEPGLEGEQTLEDVLADVEVWRGRLGQARKWLERIGGSGEEPGDEAAREETLAERLEREVAEKGYAGVVCSSMVGDAPTLTISELVVEGLVSAAFEGESIDVRAQNLSTHPAKLEEQPRISVRSRSGSLEFSLGLAADGTTPKASALRFALRGLAVDRVAASLTMDGQALLAGGTLDVTLDGTWADGRVGYLNLPLRVTLHDTTLTLPGRGSAPIETFTLPIGLRGPLDNLRVRIDRDELQKALVQAGADQLVGELKTKVDEKLEESKDELRKRLEEEAKKKLGDDVKSKLKGLLGGDN